MSADRSPSGTLSVEVFVGVNPNVANSGHSGFQRVERTAFALMLLGPVMLAVSRRRRRKASAMGWLAAMAMMAVLPALSGCGNKTPAYSAASFSTPTGTYAITVTLTDTNNVSRSAVFNIAVNSQ